MEPRSPHWSESPSTYPASPPSPGPAGAGAGRGRGPSGRRGINKRAWIAMAAAACLVVAAVVAYVALSRGEKVAADTTSQTQTQTQTAVGPNAAAKDAAAQVLVRNAMTTLEGAYLEVLTFDRARLSPAMLKVLEPAITFVAVNGTAAATAPTAGADAGAVDYSGTESTYAVGTVSASGRTFGVTVDKFSGAGDTYYVDGGPQAW